MVLARLAVVAPLPDRGGQRLVVGGHQSAIAHPAQILAGIETETAQRAYRAAALALVARAVRLAGILDYLEPVFRRDGEDRLHVSRLPVQVHRNNRAGASGDDGPDQIHVDVVGPRIAVHQHRHRPNRRHRQRRRNKCIAGHDDLVAGLHASRLERQPERIEARADADGVLGSDKTGKPLFERLDLGSENVLPVRQHPVDGGADVLAHLRMVGCQINKRYDVHRSPLES